MAAMDESLKAKIPALLDHYRIMTVATVRFDGWLQAKVGVSKYDAKGNATTSLTASTPSRPPTPCWRNR